MEPRNGNSLPSIHPDFPTLSQKQEFRKLIQEFIELTSLLKQQQTYIRELEQHNELMKSQCKEGFHQSASSKDSQCRQKVQDKIICTLRADLELVKRNCNELEEENRQLRVQKTRLIEELYNKNDLLDEYEEGSADKMRKLKAQVDSLESALRIIPIPKVKRKQQVQFKKTLKQDQTTMTLQKVFAEASVQTDKVLARRWCDIRDSDSE
jgi:hypothetical protein